jgi:hypothetical protein
MLMAALLQHLMNPVDMDATSAVNPVLLLRLVWEGTA